MPIIAEQSTIETRIGNFDLNFLKIQNMEIQNIEKKSNSLFSSKWQTKLKKMTQIKTLTHAHTHSANVKSLKHAKK